MCPEHEPGLHGEAVGSLGRRRDPEPEPEADGQQPERGERQSGGKVGALQEADHADRVSGTTSPVTRTSVVARRSSVS